MPGRGAPSARYLRRALEGRDGPRLAVECWCQAEIILVPASVVRAALTGSCGRPGCKG